MEQKTKAERREPNHYKWFRRYNTPKRPDKSWKRQAHSAHRQYEKRTVAV